MSDKDSQIAFYKQQFMEIYHLDTLDWRIALILFPTFGGFFATLGFLMTFGNHSNNILVQGERGFKAFSLFLILLAFYGMWTVSRGHVWLKIRTSVIGEAEKALKVHQMWSRIVKESRLSMITGRRIPLFLIYAFLFYMSSTVAFAQSVRDWVFVDFWIILLTLVFTTICIVINYAYYMDTLK